MINSKYQKLVVAHHKNPHHFGAVENCTHRCKGYNRICGDIIELFLRVDSGNILKEASFQGDSCALVRTSASLMCDAITGQPMESIEQLTDQVQKMLSGNGAQENLGELSILSEVRSMPSRLNCVKLPWLTLQKALHQEEDFTIS